jgi:hypothetical protein
MAKELWGKYRDEILTEGEDVNNLIAEPERMPIRFQYVDDQGSECLVEPSEEIEDVISAGAKQVTWDATPTGGALSYRQQFGEHAAELLARPEYQNWSYCARGKPGYGIQAVGPDKDDVVRTIKITPSGNYPETPPTVTCQPTFEGDPCWTGGVLHYTTYSGGGGSPWKDLVEQSDRGLNPLHALTQELLLKYKFGA